jgi:urease accessory protein
MTAVAAAPTLVRILQLASPALPIGAYSYSQGLEWAVADGIVRDAGSAERWIGDVLAHVMACGEAAVAWRLLEASADRDDVALIRWNKWFRASRETSELAAETLQMGGSLARLAGDLGVLDAWAQEQLPILAPITLPAAWAIIARGFGVAPEAALVAYLWSWLENQVMAAIKTVPLGQLAGQRMLLTLGAELPAAVAAARTIEDDNVASFAPGYVIASARHETQRTRLFRS